jgi:hypothetical protein
MIWWGERWGDRDTSNSSVGFSDCTSVAVHEGFSGTVIRERTEVNTVHFLSGAPSHLGGAWLHAHRTVRAMACLASRTCALLSFVAWKILAFEHVDERGLGSHALTPPTHRESQRELWLDSICDVSLSHRHTQSRAVDHVYDLKSMDRWVVVWVDERVSTFMRVCVCVLHAAELCATNESSA